MYSSLFGVPAGLFLITPVVARPTLQFGVPAAAHSASTPAACGLAIEVPLIVFVPLFSQVDVMFTPGAYTSTQPPKFEKEALLSLMSEAATVSVPAALDGEELHASAFELPAATAV